MKYAVIKDNTVIDMITGDVMPVYPFPHDKVIEAGELQRWDYFFDEKWNKQRYYNADEGFVFVRIADGKEIGTSLRLGLIDKDNEDSIDNYKQVKIEENEYT